MGIWDEIINSKNQEDAGQNEEGTSSCLKTGSICPKCGAAHLEYDSKLNLVCPTCGYEIAAGFT